MTASSLVKRWWHLFRYSPNDSNYYVKQLPRIVAIGGGTGLSSLLRGLKQKTPYITAIVAVTDNGRSSGFLRKNYHTLPPGDIRQCIAALAPDEEQLTKLLNFRFNKGRGLSGHPFGNLLMVALSEIEGGFERAVLSMNELLKVSGRVLPATLDKIQIIGHMKSGAIIEGESEISKAGHLDPIDHIELSAKAKSYPAAIQEINAADIIVIGPGSLYTSIIPPLLLSGIRLSIKRSKALKIYACNASTERGETEGYSAEDHINTLNKVIGERTPDVMLVNNRRAKLPKITEGKLGAITPVFAKSKKIGTVLVIAEDLIDSNNPLHHDSQKLAAAIMAAYNNSKQ